VPAAIPPIHCRRPYAIVLVKCTPLPGPDTRRDLLITWLGEHGARHSKTDH